MTALIRGSIGKLLFYNEVYQKILPVPGVMCEFGVHLGGTAALLQNLSSTYEPYNHTRVYYGFDTFGEGFPSIDTEDGEIAKTYDFRVPEGFYDGLNEVLHNVKKTGSHSPDVEPIHLIKGDACETFPKWLEDNPHALISLAIMDFDIYKPTRDVLKLMQPRLVKGSVIVFDELNHPDWPGETIAVQEVLGLNNLKLHRVPYHAYGCYSVFGE